MNRINVYANLKNTRWWLLLSLLLIFSLSGCGEEIQDDSDSGEVVIGLTDAPGDFVSYNVDVVSLELTKANGAVIQTLPVSTRVDFAQYTEMTEFLTAATIPAGTYVKAKMTLDYSNADIQVENNAGDAVPAGTLQDEAGNPISILELDVKLDGHNALFIGPGVPAHLTLDFDLSASHSVDVSGLAPVVTVQPFLLAEVDVESPKIHRARGALQSVNIQESSFRIIIRPFIHAISGGDERFGTLKVATNDQTIYDVDGSREQGSAGLDLLNAKSALTAVVVLGDLKFNPVRFEAHSVMAGSSVPGGSMDVVTGNVIQRSADLLIVKGATLVRSDGNVVFNDRVEISLSANTVVRRQMSMDAMDISDISVGQRVSVFGTLTNQSSQGLALDATEGYAHMTFTTLRATVIATSPALTVNLQSIDGRRVALFDFTNTGAISDADPSNYEIDYAGLDISGLGEGKVIKIRGFVTPFQTISSPDFTARTIVDVSDAAAVMVVGWPLTSTTALNVDTTARTMTLDLSGAGYFHHVSNAGVITDLTQTGLTTAIQGNSLNLGLYFVVQNGIWDLRLSYDAYLSEIQTRLDNGYAVRSVIATGKYDTGTSQFTAGGMRVHFM